MRKETYKNASYDNAKPSWQKMKLPKVECPKDCKNCLWFQQVTILHKDRCSENRKRLYLK